MKKGIICVCKRIGSWPIFRHSVFLAVLWFGATLVGCLLQLLEEKNDVYLIFKYSFSQALEKLPFNLAIVGMLILSFVFIERKKEFWAAFLIVLGTLTNLYTVVGLAFFLFSKRRVAFLGGLLFWAAVLFVLPMLYSSPGYVLGEYVHCVITYNDWWIIILGILLFFAPYFRISQYDYRPFRIHYLCSALLFMALFRISAGNSGSIASVVAVYLWYLNTPIRKTVPVLNMVLLIFFLVLTSLSPTLKALPCLLIWLKIVWEQLRCDFSEPLPLAGQAATSGSIDIILPCYNPSAGWEQMMIEKHAELQAVLPGRVIRLIVVNDASLRGFTAEAQQRLLRALPGTIIVDNQVNQGKGAAVRDGLSRATSEIMLYTDYDFPYTTDSLLSVLGCLDEGYDVVIAVRNHTYYENLTYKRKIMSYASRFLNFALLGLTHTDTQGGLKGFNQKGKVLLASTRVNRFLFDTEFIYKASMKPGILIKDVPAYLRSNVYLPNMRRGVLFEELKNLFMIAWRG